MRPRAATPETSRGPGGGGRDRTDDLKLAKLALSQLSYAPEPPVFTLLEIARTPARGALALVGRAGFEPATSRLSSARSNQLSYQPSGKAPKPTRKARGRRFSERKGCVDGGNPDPAWAEPSRVGRSLVRPRQRGPSDNTGPGRTVLSGPARLCEQVGNPYRPPWVEAIGTLAALSLERR